MNRSWRVARVAGIDVSVHWTFVALLAWLTLSALSQGGGVQAVRELSLLTALFGCVVLHELGHALAARHFGIATIGITLLPIGGVAALERIPRKPLQELVIALAGPAVNLVLLLLLVPTWVAFQLSGWASFDPASLANVLLERLVIVNGMLILFNLLPAFPMDGGRVLRAVLAWRADYVRATRTATRAGQLVAILLACIGLIWNPMLILIAVFVATAGEAEYQQVLAERMASWTADDFKRTGRYSAATPASHESCSSPLRHRELVIESSWGRKTPLLQEFARREKPGPAVPAEEPDAAPSTPCVLVGIQLPHGIHLVRSYSGRA